MSTWPVLCGTTEAVISEKEVETSLISEPNEDGYKSFAVHVV